MAAYIRNLSFPALLIFFAGFAMLIPVVFSLVIEDFRTARAFFYSSLMVLMVAILLGYTSQTRTRKRSERSLLMALFLAYLWLPLVLALPFDQAVGNTRFINSYFDMVSALTTTGAEIFEPERLAPGVHLWRGIVGWSGGLLLWICAFAILAPLNLGGFEVTSEAKELGATFTSLRSEVGFTPAEGLRRQALHLTPIYLSLTIVLAMSMSLGGEQPYVAAIHAMSTMSTSGISPVGGLSDRPLGLWGEMLIFCFFAFALTRRSYAGSFARRFFDEVLTDRELRLAMFFVTTIPTLLFLRHWVGAFEVNELNDARSALEALWGSIFTVLSFLTTTGFVSDYWDTARAWSGLDTPGLILVGLALMGGGVATTAGGIKLLRIYALYKHGLREISKPIYPSAVAGAGRMGRSLRREGAYIAWVVFMLLVMTCAGVMVALAATGLDFESASILAISALTTTGPLAEYAGEDPISYFALTDLAKLILAASMIIGRIETLVIISLFIPFFWRN